MNYLAILGLLWIIKSGSILNKPRSWITRKSRFFATLFRCSLCIGFWIGLGYGCYQYSLDRSIHGLIVNTFSIGTAQGIHTH